MKDVVSKGENKEALSTYHKRYRLAVFLVIPVPGPAGHPSFVFVTINEARRDFVTSVLGALSLGLKTLGSKTDHSRASSTAVNNLLNYSAMSSLHSTELHKRSSCT
jgi:hypothetical protein